MKNHLLNTIRKLTLIFLVVAMYGANDLKAQDDKMPKDLFFEIACFKAKSPGVVDFFKTTGKAINQEMIRQGIIENWSFFKVDFPNGSTCECDFRAIRMFRGMDALEKLKDASVREQIIKKIWPDKTGADIANEFNNLIDFRYSEVYNMIDAVVPKPTTSKLVVVNFMDVKSENRRTYVEMESDIFKPLHEANLKSGKLVDWVLASRVIPYGVEIKTDYITIDKYETYANMRNAKFMDMFKQIHPTLDGKSTMSKMGNMRTLIKSEIWRSIPID